MINLQIQYIHLINKICIMNIECNNIILYKIYKIMINLQITVYTFN